MRELLLLTLLGSAWAHPGADSHLHATAEDACAPDQQARRLAALIDEGRLEEAHAELDSQQACALPSVGAQVGRARLLSLEHQTEGAIEILDEVLRTEPRHPHALFLRGELLAEQGRFDSAADDALTLARVAPESVTAWRGALKSAWSTGDAGRARAVATEARAATGDHIALRTDVAQAELAHGDPAVALELARTLPERLPTLELVADCLAAMGHPDAASAYDRATAAASALRTSPARTEALARLHARAEALR